MAKILFCSFARVVSHEASTVLLLSWIWIDIRFADPVSGVFFVLFVLGFF